MAERQLQAWSLTARPRRRRARGLPWTRHETVASAAALAALFSAAACGSDSGAAPATTTSAAPTTAPTTVEPTTSGPMTTTPPTTKAPPVTTAPRATAATTGATAPPVTRAASTTAPTAGPTTVTFPDGGYCVTNPDGTQTCAVPGRPLRRRRRRTLLLPVVDGADRPGDEARAEYASVAAFGELALRLLAVGAPADLVAACHAAALDEIRHASACEQLDGRTASFGAIPGLVGHRLGGRRRSRRVQLRRLAVESFLDGWVNEGAAAAQLRLRAEAAPTAEDRDLLRSMAEDEQRHADLARSIVTWCFDEDPGGVGRALGRLAAA